MSWQGDGRASKGKLMIRGFRTHGLTMGYAITSVTGVGDYVSGKRLGGPFCIHIFIARGFT